MNPGLRDLVGHHAWANAELLAFCKQLDAATLAATAPGTYGSILATLQHLIDSDASYIYRLTGAWPGHPWPDDEEVPVDVLAERAAILGDVLQRFVATDWDEDRLGVGFGDNDEVFAVRAGIFLTQIVHHGNEHRTQVCTVLGARGIETPDISAWEYALVTGRMTLQSPLPGEKEPPAEPVGE